MLALNQVTGMPIGDAEGTIEPPVGLQRSDVVALPEFDVDVADVERGVEAAQEVGHEPVQPLGVQRRAVSHGEAEAAHGPPVVAPAPREQARPHGLWHRQEAEQMVDDLVREGADLVLAISGFHG